MRSIFDPMTDARAFPRINEPRGATAPSLQPASSDRESRRRSHRSSSSQHGARSRNLRPSAVLPDGNRVAAGTGLSAPMARPTLFAVVVRTTHCVKACRPTKYVLPVNAFKPLLSCTIPLSQPAACSVSAWSVHNTELMKHAVSAANTSITVRNHRYCPHSSFEASQLGSVRLPIQSLRMQRATREQLGERQAGGAVPHECCSPRSHQGVEREDGRDHVGAGNRAECAHSRVRVLLWRHVNTVRLQMKRNQRKLELLLEKLKGQAAAA